MPSRWLLEEQEEEALAGRILALSRPMEPLFTGVEADLTAGRDIKDIRAVLFDVYGTLFISGSGDIGVRENIDSEEALNDAFKAAGFTNLANDTAHLAVEELTAAIRREHARGREAGFDYPEVDIRDIWSEVLTGLIKGMKLAGDCRPDDVNRLAVEYECRVNPVWPMPGLKSLLNDLKETGLPLGIVSNAQFMTPLLFKAFCGAHPENFGFEPSLLTWSYRYKIAKPSSRLFEPGVQTLRQKFSIEPFQTLYVGNDMLNDVRAAAQSGMKTALFAGDKRSYRPRLDHELCRGLKPDFIITELEQMLHLFQPR